MTNEKRDKAIRILQWLHDNNFLFRSTEEDVKYATKFAIQALEREPSKDMEEIEEVINCDADAEIKLKMISNIVYSKPHYFKTLEQEPCDVFDEYGNYKYPSDVELTEPNTATSMPCEDAISRILKRMWNCRGKHTTSIDKVKMEQIIHDELSPVRPQEPKYCDRNICLKNEYNGIGCDECEVTKNQEPNTVIATEDGAYYKIKALQAQADGDLISRQQARSEYGDWYGYGYQDNWFYKRLGNMPSVAIPNKTGHWIDYDCNEDKYDKIKCSECGHSFIVDSYHWCDIGFTEDDLKYCPNCGARMESEVR